MTILKVGQRAPDFRLPVSEDEMIGFKDFLGKKNIILYFYPKDDTPGCTIEACDFRDNLSRLQSNDTVVFGVSKDSLKSHKKFKEKHQLSFPLLSDESGEVIEKYDSWQEKTMFGKKYMGIERNTFLIDKAGVIRHIWKNVKVAGHVDAILKEIEGL